MLMKEHIQLMIANKELTSGQTYLTAQVVYGISLYHLGQQPVNSFNVSIIVNYDQLLSIYYIGLLDSMVIILNDSDVVSGKDEQLVIISQILYYPKLIMTLQQKALNGSSSKDVYRW